MSRARRTARRRAWRKRVHYEWKYFAPPYTDNWLPLYPLRYFTKLKGFY